MKTFKNAGHVGIKTDQTEDAVRAGLITEASTETKIVHEAGATVTDDYNDHQNEVKSLENASDEQTTVPQEDTNVEPVEIQHACAISAPLTGAEPTIQANTITDANLKEALEVYGITPNTIAAAMKMQSISRFEKPRFVQQRVHLKINIDGEEGIALVDSGATINTITEEACKKFGINIVKPLGIPPKVLDFEGKECSTTGIAHASIRMGRANYDGIFTVIRSTFGSSIILGTPFLSNYGLIDLLRSGISDVAGPNCVYDGNPSKNE